MYSLGGGGYKATGSGAGYGASGLVAMVGERSDGERESSVRDGRAGGETGIRTLDTLSSIHAFQACAFSHSAISPLRTRWSAILAAPTVFIVADCVRAGTLVRDALRSIWILFFFFQLLSQIVLVAHLADGVQLRLEPVDVVLLVGKDLFRQLARPSVIRCNAELDAVIQTFHSVVLQLHVILVLLFHRLADVDLEVVGHVGRAIQIQNPLDQLLGVYHFFDRLFADELCQPLIAPVLAHFRVKEILVDRRQFRFQDLIEKIDNLGVAFHGTSHELEALALAQAQPEIGPSRCVLGKHKHCNALPLNSCGRAHDRRTPTVRRSRWSTDSKGGRLLFLARAVGPRWRAS